MSASMAAFGGDGPPDEQRGHVVTVSLSADELRLIFAQLLTTRDCEKDFGRCLCVSKEWADVLENTPSLWFKLFQMLDPQEAARAAAVAPAPAPGVLAKQGKDDFHDHDFKRRWVEQYCWRKTQLCSRCFVPSHNAPIHAWKVRLCSSCIATSILNKTDAAKTFMLTPTDLATLPTWVSGVQTPFGGLVKFYFRRHLERAAAQKHGASGVEAARLKQTERKEKRKEATVEKKQSKQADIDELLKSNGLERGYDDLYRLGTGLAHAIRQFVDPKTAGKKSKRHGAQETEAPSVLTTFEQASAAIRKELARAKRRKAIEEACTLAGFVVNQSSMPGVHAAYEEFVTEEDASFDALLKSAKATPEPASKKRKTGASTGKKKGKKGRAYQTSDEEDSDDGGDEAEAMELSDEDDEPVAAKPKPSRRRGGAAGGVVDLSAAAVATVRELMLRERRDAEVFAEFKLKLSLSALDHKISQLAKPSFYQATKQFKGLLEKLKEPLPSAAPPAASKRGASAAGSHRASASAAAVALAATAAEEIVSDIVDRKHAIGAALDTKMQALLASGLTAATIARLLDCSAAEAAEVFHHLRIDHRIIAEDFALHETVTLARPAPDGSCPAMTLDEMVATMEHHLRLKLRKGEMKERVATLFEKLCPAEPPATEGEVPPLIATIRTMRDSFASPSRGLTCTFWPAGGRAAPPGGLAGVAGNVAALGALLRESLDECRLQVSTCVVDSSGMGHDLALVPATGDTVAVAQAPSTQLGRVLKLAADLLSPLEPVRKQFVHCILDGRVEAAAGAPPQDADASQIAARIMGAADARAELLAAIRAVQLPKATEKFTLESAPSELIERLEHFLAHDEFTPRSTDVPVTGEEAKTALLAWAADSLSAQDRRFVKLEKAFTDAELDTSGLRKYDLSKRLDPYDYSPTMEHSLLSFLRGPTSHYERRNMKRWRDEFITILEEKARTLLRTEETRGEREAASARLDKMNALRRALEAKMQAKLRTLPEWTGGEYWAQLHAKAQNKLFKKFSDDTVSRTFPAPKPKTAAGGAAVPEAAVDDAAAAPEVDFAAVAAAAAETPEFEAAIAEMTQLVKAAKGLSYSVLQATRMQEHGGHYAYGDGIGDSDYDEGF